MSSYSKSFVHTCVTNMRASRIRTSRIVVTSGKQEKGTIFCSLNCQGEFHKLLTTSGYRSEVERYPASATAFGNGLDDHTHTERLKAIINFSKNYFIFFLCIVYFEIHRSGFTSHSRGVLKLDCVTFKTDSWSHLPRPQRTSHVQVTFSPNWLSGNITLKVLTITVICRSAIFSFGASALQTLRCYIRIKFLVSIDNC